MKAKLLNQKGNKLSFVLEEASPAFVNALRRTASEDVPTMAIEMVEFRKNSSALYDETVAHRMGLLPLKTDLKSYNLPERCQCGGGGCARCQVKLTLTAKGQKSGAVVRAEDIKTKDPAIVPAFPKTPVVKLFEGQEIEAEMTAVLGTGKVHTKWAPGHVYFRQLPTVTISKKGEGMLECERLCPTQVFESKNGKLMVRQNGEQDCILCGACVDASEGEVKVLTNKENYVVYVESWGQLPPEDIIEQSIAILDEKADDLIATLKGRVKQKAKA